MESPSSDRRLPFVTDLALLFGITVGLVVSGVGAGPAGRVETVLTSVFVIAYAFTVPGYALVSALFARRDESWQSLLDTVPRGGERIDGRSRAVLSVGLSPIVTGAVVLSIDWSPLALERSTVLGGVVAFVLGCTAVTLVRRLSLPDDQRYRVVLAAPGFEGLSAGQLAFALITVASLLVAGASLGHTATTWDPGERFTELSLVTLGSDGDRIANGYDPDGRLLVGVENHEHREMDYTLVVRPQRVSVENGRATVLRDLGESRLRVRDLSHGAIRYRELALSIDSDRPVRLTVFLYRDSPPSTVTVANAYRTTHLWFNASRDAGGSSAR